MSDNFLYDTDGGMVRDTSKHLRAYYDDGLDRPYKFAVLDGSGDPVTTWYMVYDEAGNRVSKLEYAGSEEWTGTKNYFGNGIEVRDAPETAATLVYPFDGYGRYAYSNGDEAWRYETYVKNYLGSTMKVIRATDEIYRADYEPYGRARGESDASDPSLTQKFTGKELDAGIDLTYFGARYYDDDFGVWVSPDSKRQFHSVYSYGRNPIGTVDPDGNWNGPSNSNQYLMGMLEQQATGAVQMAPSYVGQTAKGVASDHLIRGLAGFYMGGTVAGPARAVAGRIGVAAYEYVATTGIPAAFEATSTATKFVGTYWPEIAGIAILGGMAAERLGIHEPVSNFLNNSSEVDVGPTISPVLDLTSYMWDLGGYISGSCPDNE